MRPSDSALQCHVGRSPQGDDKNTNDEYSIGHFPGYDLADELSWLNILSLPSSPHYASTRKTGTNTESAPDYPVLFKSQNFRSLNAGSGTLRDERTVKYQGIQAKSDQVGRPADLVNVIFGGITMRKGNKRLARLQMGDSGRWRILRYTKPPGTFPL